MKQYRQDRLSQTLQSPVPGPGGSVICQGVVAKPGIYLYADKRADGTDFIRRELVTADMLFAVQEDGSAGITTLGLAPLTLHHPPVMVDAQNAQKYTHGDVGAKIVRGPGGYVVVDLTIRTQDAQSAIADGTAVELSPGYFATIDNTPGVDPEFGEYDSRQTSRVYNHVALVDAARGGPECRVHLDGADVPVLTSERQEVIVPASEPAVPATGAAPRADDSSYESSYSETVTETPDGGQVVESTSTSKSTYTPAKALPEGMTAAMAEWIEAIVEMALSAKTDRAQAPTTEPEAIVPDNAAPDAAPRVDFMAQYRERRELERRADNAAADTLTNVQLAEAILTAHSVNLDGLSDEAKILQALTFPVPQVDAVKAPTKPAPEPEGSRYNAAFRKAATELRN